MYARPQSVFPAMGEMSNQQIRCSVSVGVRTRTEIGWQSLQIDRCRKRKQPWRAVLALRSALAGAPFWLYAGGVAPSPEPRGLKAQRPPRRAESVDSFSLQHAIEQPESENLTHDCPSPFEDADLASNVIKFPFGVSRRAHARKRRAMPATGLSSMISPRPDPQPPGMGAFAKSAMRLGEWLRQRRAIGDRDWISRLLFRGLSGWSCRKAVPTPLSMKATECRWSEGTAQHL